MINNAWLGVALAPILFSTCRDSNSGRGIWAFHHHHWVIFWGILWHSYDCNFDLLWDSSMLCRRHLSCDCDVIEVMMTSLILLMVMTFKLWRHQLWWLELLLWHHISWYYDVTDVFSCDIIEVEPSSVVTSSVTIWIVGTKTNQIFLLKISLPHAQMTDVRKMFRRFWKKLKNQKTWSNKLIRFS